MNILIIDDDLNFSDQLKKDIIEYFSTIYDDISVNIINRDFKTITDYSSADLIFLDIDLKKKYNGISLGLYIQSVFPKAILVFVSSHDELVFSALSIRFFQFIRKSRYQTDVIKVLNQVKKYLDDNIKLVTIKINGREYNIKLCEIIYILSVGHDLFIKTMNDDFCTHIPLSRFMEEIDYEELVQIERNLVINLNYTKKVMKTRVIMFDNDDDEGYVVGRKYQNNLIKKYEEFLIK